MDTSQLEPRVNNLPKWARDLMEGLDRKVSDLERQCDILTRERTAISAEEAKIGWEVLSYRVKRGVYPIPDRAEVAFKTKHGLISCSLREDTLQVCAENGVLVVVSHGGANVLSIETR